MQNHIINPYNILSRIENISIQIRPTSSHDYQPNLDTQSIQNIPKCKNCNIKHTKWIEDIHESRKAFVKYANSSDIIDKQHKHNILEHINLIDEIIQELCEHPPNLHKLYIENQEYDSFSIQICAHCYNNAQ